MRKSQSVIPAAIQTTGALIAAGGVVFTAFRGLAELRRTREQRKEELDQRRREFRHKQALLAIERTREVFDDPKARSALQMLDWLKAPYTNDDGKTLLIYRRNLQSSLRVTNLTFTEEEKFVRTRFEAPYDRLEQIESLVKLEILNFSDLETNFRYYVRIAKRPPIKHTDFLVYCCINN